MIDSCNALYIYNFRWAILVILFVLMGTSRIFGQTAIGAVKGLLRDSAHNYVMPAATVSIYKSENGELVSYQLANSYGRFLFKQLPIGVSLRLIATYTGYKPTKQEFVVYPETAEIDLGVISMDRLAISLREITVSSLPPVQMRGDTLEFNADAFKLDTNAVVEDMLKKLPGVTVWSDGVITVNGKKIHKLLVEGKEFFGGDSKIALQNLSKDAVRKIQVYEDKNDPEPMDLKTNMNIVLKKDKKNGYFGKIGGSVGTTSRYDGNGVISYFSPKDQISIGGVINNVNKTADDINSLIRINSFKGQGINNEYNADFTKPGSFEFRAVGFTAMHDFSKRENTNIDTNNLKVDYFTTNSHVGSNEQLNTVISLTPDNVLTQETIIVASSRTNQHGMQTAYEKKFDHAYFNASYGFMHNLSDYYNIYNSTTEGGSMGGRSTNSEEHNRREKAAGHSGRVKFTSNRYADYGFNQTRSVDMELEYWFNLNHSTNNRNHTTSFSSTDTSENKLFNRRYAIVSDAAEHHFSNSFNDILGLSSYKEPYLRIDVKNQLTYYKNISADVVSDLSERGGFYLPNVNLTTHNDTRILDYMPGMNISKTISSRLSNRYSRTWHFDLFARAQLYGFRNTSLKDFQNLKRSYWYFVPSSSLGYKNNHLGSFRNSFLLRYKTAVTYPTLQQWAPLVDDANIYFLEFGNIGLEPSYSHDLSFDFDYSSSNIKNEFQGSMQIAVGSTNNFITDSSYYDELGRSVYYPINVPNERHLTHGAKVTKLFKFDEHQLQSAVKYNMSYSRNSSSLNGTFYDIERYSWTTNAELTYNYKELAGVLGHTWFRNESDRLGLSKYRYTNLKLYAGISFTSHLGPFIGSRLDINKSKASNTDNIYFTIWNVDLGYRFLKGRNAEVKLSGLDLLHQNNNIFNTIGNNTIVTGTRNVLQQYFMVTLAYYPRKFGIRKTDN